MTLQHVWLACAAVLGSCASTGDLQEPEPQIRQPDPLHRHFEPALEWSDTGELVTEPISDGAEFDEVLPSWNIDGRRAFTVDVRVAGVDGSWSPWLRIGDWNVQRRTGEELTKFDGGKVAVDVLNLSKPCTTAQLRFASTRDRALGIEDIVVRIVLSDMRGLDAAVDRTREAAWPKPVELEVKPRSQRTVAGGISHRVCSPTSVAMVTDFHGPNIATRRMAQRLFDPHFDLYGNWNRAVQGAYSFGVPGELVRISSWEHAREYLADGRPIIASIRAKEGQLEGAPYPKTAGHLLVVTGLGPKGKVRVNDPAAHETKTVARTYSRADMETVWFANGGVAYVLGRATEPEAAGK